MILEDLLTSNLETIQTSSFLKPLEPRQTDAFKNILANLGAHVADTPDPKATLVFRGEKLGNLRAKLSTKRSCMEEEKLFRLLFYFGDKAKAYYTCEDPAAMKLRWLHRIEDASEEILSAIFCRIRDFLAKQKSQRFRNSNKEFADFFAADNRSTFASRLVDDQTARDYYLYVLHTAGLGNNSFLVSTSRSYEVAACNFAGDHPDGCVIYYVVPEPLKDFAISHEGMPGYDSFLINLGLPTYNEQALHPDQHEVAIRGALFSHHILGLRVLCGDRFIVNPHLFSDENKVDSILKGLVIDQTGFAERLSDTGYASGVGISLNGNYQTISRS